jgi:hypothetical protein
VHPIFDHGRFNGDGPDAAFVMEASYIGRQRFESTLGRDGLTMHFAGWSQPLEVYVDALAAAGLAITSLREPQPKFDGTDERLRQFERVPLFLWLKARTHGVQAPPLAKATAKRRRLERARAAV